MKWLFLLLSLFICTMTVRAEEPEELYDNSAVLMDAETGRVLFEKNGYEQKSMASTTKIMTCILALENGNLEDIVTVSEYATSQPKVHLGAPAGSQFYLKDLLLSLMLESHNDSAVVIAEHLAGNVEAFAKMMNQKAEELGCEQTHFVTPNGLDASNEGGNHSTTAADLARIMSYCIMQSPCADSFLEITQIPSYSFTDITGNSTYSLTNHNSFLEMMEGAISGKTGYTSKAGYCYVGALERDGRTFIVSLLACGWPNHKDYKWKDTVRLMEYALANYEYKNVFEQTEIKKIKIHNGIPNDNGLFGESFAVVNVEAESTEELNVLIGKEEEVKILARYAKELQAPVIEGEEVGTVTYYLDETILKQYPIVVAETVEAKEPQWYFVKLIEKYIKMA